MRLDMIFKHPNGLDELNDRLVSNPRFIFYLYKDTGRDKRTRLSRLKGRYIWRHKRQGYNGVIKLIKDNGRFWVEIDDQSAGLLTGAFISWIIRNANDLVAGIDMRL